MAKLSVSQLRSGEGSILTRFSHLGPEALPDALPHLFEGAVLLVAADSFEAQPPPGGARVEPGLWSLTGDAARSLLRDHARWAARGAIFGLFAAMPDPDVRRRGIPDPLRPWDPERMKARAYGQLGPASRFAHRGLWFLDEADRRRFIEAGVSRVLEGAGLRLPNGDVTLVLEMPTDSTFEAEFRVSGRGDAFRLRRDFRSAGTVREWSVVQGEWRCVETRRRRARGRSWRERLIGAAASTGIFVLSIPTFLVVAFALVVAKVSGGSSPVSKTAAGARGGSR